MPKNIVIPTTEFEANTGNNCSAETDINYGLIIEYNDEDDTIETIDNKPLETITIIVPWDIVGDINKSNIVEGKHKRKPFNRVMGYII
jgi:hypothetical protein